MKPIESIDLIEPQLANAREYWGGWGGVSPSATDADLVLYRSGLPHPLINGVLRSREAATDQLISEVRRQLEGLPWLWWVGPGSDPQLATRLGAAGAVHAMSFPVMAVRLDQVLNRAAPADLVIEEVNGLEAMAEWVSAWSPNFGLRVEDRDALVEREARRSDVVRFAGRIDGKVVGTSEVLFSRGVAGVYVVTTDPAYRRRGIGTAMTDAALKLARARGYLVATLQASDDGQPVYVRMGFSTVETLKLFSF